MAGDTRDRNKYFSHDSIRRYAAGYADGLHGALLSVDEYQLCMAIQYLQEARLVGRIFVAGNGGSSSIADHLTCDFSKGIRTKDHAGFHAHSLVNHGALFTAIANDLGYERTFSYQLKLFHMHESDCLILISSSGNSENIVRAAKFARKIGTPIIGLTGFSGGKLKELADVSLHIPFDNYGIVEDSHQAIMHILAQYIYLNDRRE